MSDSTTPANKVDGRTVGATHSHEYMAELTNKRLGRPNGSKRTKADRETFNTQLAEKSQKMLNKIFKKMNDVVDGTNSLKSLSSAAADLVSIRDSMSGNASLVTTDNMQVAAELAGTDLSHEDIAAMMSNASLSNMADIQAFKKKLEK